VFRIEADLTQLLEGPIKRLKAKAIAKLHRGINAKQTESAAMRQERAVTVAVLAPSLRRTVLKRMSLEDRVGAMAAMPESAAEEALLAVETDAGEPFDTASVLSSAGRDSQQQPPGEGFMAQLAPNEAGLAMKRKQKGKMDAWQARGRGRSAANTAVFGGKGEGKGMGSSVAAKEASESTLTNGGGDLVNAEEAAQISELKQVEAAVVAHKKEIAVEKSVIEALIEGPMRKLRIRALKRIEKEAEEKKREAHKLKTAIKLQRRARELSFAMAVPLEGSNATQSRPVRTPSATAPASPGEASPSVDAVPTASCWTPPRLPPGGASPLTADEMARLCHAPEVPEEARPPRPITLDAEGNLAADWQRPTGEGGATAEDGSTTAAARGGALAETAAGDAAPGPSGAVGSLPSATSSATSPATSSATSSVGSPPDAAGTASRVESVEAEATGAVSAEVPEDPPWQESLTAAAAMASAAASEAAVVTAKLESLEAALMAAPPGPKRLLKERAVAVARRVALQKQTEARHLQAEHETTAARANEAQAAEVEAMAHAAAEAASAQALAEEAAAAVAAKEASVAHDVATAAAEEAAFAEEEAKKKRRVAKEAAQRRAAAELQTCIKSSARAATKLKVRSQRLKAVAVASFPPVVPGRNPFSRIDKEGNLAADWQRPTEVLCPSCNHIVLAAAD